MSGAATMRAAAGGSQAGAPNRIWRSILVYGGLMLLDALALLLIYNFAADGIWELAIAFSAVTLLVNVINLHPGLIPLRWISPALALMTLLVLYPLIYTVYVAFTNYGDGHLLTEQQAVKQVLRETYLPEDGDNFSWQPYVRGEGEYALLLTDEAGATFWLDVNAATLEPVTIEGTEPPTELNGFTFMSARADRLRIVSALGGQDLGPSDRRLVLSRTAITGKEQRFVYDSAAGTLLDQETGEVYRANQDVGYFVSDAYTSALAENPEARISDFYLKTASSPTGIGFRVNVGLSNFERFLTSPAISGPLVSVLIWTFVFAFMSVFMTFSLGLLVALMLQARTPGKRFFRTALIVPYAIPSLISVGIWKGMLNPTLGVLNNGLVESGFLSAPIPVFSDPTWGRIAILFVNLWLGYPYFMLVTSGALAAIPRDMYEAAEVDGANGWQQFWSLTIPMLLISVGPLLIASFTFNFNNFVIIDAFNEGGPPTPGTTTPAGQTDILISYAFRLAFGTGRGADYGLASAITIIIFIIVASITLFQFRFTRQWEEASENV